jgi:hypothetical protein
VDDLITWSEQVVAAHETVIILSWYPMIVRRVSEAMESRLERYKIDDRHCSPVEHINVDLCDMQCKSQ